MKLYFTRHGKTEWNQARRFQGMTGDSPLLPESYEEIRQLGEYLKEVSFETIYCSPMSRTVKTVEGIVSELQIKPEIVLSDELKELGLGDLEGQKIALGKELYPKQMQAMRSNPADYDPTPFKGETFEEMLERSVPYVKEKIAEASTGPLLFVSHGMTLGGIIQTLVGTPLPEIRKQGGLNNNSLSIVDVTDGVYTLELWNDDSFLTK
ncbi:histidine phosphatase family protein [Vagococcus sp. DIV0080]|uniref:Histidine phosphatase family protein n=1 Tax=Candidatus Vagococcus giribetii TaxID=2230876 RepID=A0ABS3HRP0_9ENTE|nr:histidine phosphatase family protein [Vagococcus sp. DIV0080]